MEYRHKQLRQDLTTLSTAFGQLGAYLTEVAKDITSPGVSPSDKVVEQISAARKQFDLLGANVHALAAEMLVNPLVKLSELGSIAALDSLLVQAAAAEESRNFIETEREKGLAVLARVLSIAHRDSKDFKPLADSLATATALRNAIEGVKWPHRHADSAALIAEKHPLAGLLKLVETHDILDDEECLRLEEQVTEHFGRPLAVAVLRGKLVVSAGAKAPVAAPSPAVAPAVAAQPPAPPVAAQPPAPPVQAPPPPVAVQPAPPPVAAQAPAPPPVAVQAPPPPVAAQPAPPPVAVQPPPPPVAVQPPPPVAVQPPPPPVAVQPPPPAAASATPAAPPTPKPAPAPKPSSVTQLVAAVLADLPKPTSLTSTEPPKTPRASASPAPAAAPAAVAEPPVAPKPVAETPNPAPAPEAAKPTAAPAPTPVAETPKRPAEATQPVPVIPSTKSVPAPTIMVPIITDIPKTASPAEKKEATAPSVAALSSAIGVQTAAPAAEPAERRDRKEPRLATSPSVVKADPPEEKTVETILEEVKKGGAPASTSDVSGQRPQRWGFWRGNR